MLDVFQIADILVEKVKKEYKEDIAVIAYYGSYALGKANEKSDLDFFFIPNNPKGNEASIQFIIDGIGFDFWPISWEYAEKMASFEDRTTIIADSKILYVRSEEDENRFNELKKSIDNMKTGSENRNKLLDQAITELHKSYLFLYKMNKDEVKNSLTLMRVEAFNVVTTVLKSLALLNQTYFTRGWGQNMDQISNLSIKPDLLENWINNIISLQSCEQIKLTSEELVESVQNIIESQQKTTSEHQAFSDVFNGYYEEVKSNFNKIITACEKDDLYTAFFISIQTQTILSYFLGRAEHGVWYSDLSSYQIVDDLYHQFHFPDLIQNSNNLRLLKELVIELEDKFSKLLKSSGVKFNVFNNIEEFRSFIEN
ncbi:nucleotidyltransferase domain-containing protein [Chengkuizengella axinellae]|uniref:Nucleotidyltransferase domain-containing protein n=1 Tax=Chengkuizengella axinellae TaxID=3064388 RepID=A0ABT9J6G4_9BACL|nr:nucleotidyltransferase domain-containing protein [Chengkuizengella sp. 2205SS18-9]MDP5277190.1 nucleotidyltransferase domain-containing protein [Chengkuizengella sp. 2205SS18-9]